MNKKINIIKNAYILFIINVIIFITMVFFRSLYSKLGYNAILINVFMIVNIVLLVLGIVFNVLFLKDPNKYDNKRVGIIIIASFVVYLLLNIVGTYFINKSLSSGYTKMNSKLSSYCDTYGCDRYETIQKNGYEQFIIKKTYFDYNNVENDIKVTTEYDKDKVLDVKAEVYSQNEMFSETLIKDVLKDYFYNFGYEVKEDLIKKAFDERFSSSTSDDNATYKVEEIYDGDELNKIKTTIFLDLKQD